MGRYQFPPLAEPELFENFCKDYFKEYRQAKDAQLVGRKGQRQKGIDVLLTFEGAYEGVQCKKYSYYTGKVTIDNVNDIIHDACNFIPNIRTLYIATTCARNARIQEYVAELSQNKTRQRNFTIAVHFWDDFNDNLICYPRIIGRYFSQFIMKPEDLRDSSFSDTQIIKTLSSDDEINSLITSALESSSISSNYGSGDEGHLRRILVEIAKNAQQHSGMKCMTIEISENELVLTYDGSIYDPYNLLKESEGGGGKAEMEDFVITCLERFHLSYSNVENKNYVTITFPGNIEKVGRSLPLSYRIHSRGSTLERDFVKFLEQNKKTKMLFLLLDNTAANMSDIIPLMKRLEEYMPKHIGRVNFWIYEGSERLFENAKKWGYDYPYTIIKKCE